MYSGQINIEIPELRNNMTDGKSMTDLIKDYGPYPGKETTLESSRGSSQEESIIQIFRRAIFFAHSPSPLLI